MKQFKVYWLEGYGDSVPPRVCSLVQLQARDEFDLDDVDVEALNKLPLGCGLIVGGATDIIEIERIADL